MNKSISFCFVFTSVAFFTTGTIGTNVSSDTTVTIVAHVTSFSTVNTVVTFVSSVTTFLSVFETLGFFWGEGLFFIDMVVKYGMKQILLKFGLILTIKTQTNSRTTFDKNEVRS